MSGIDENIEANIAAYVNGKYYPSISKNDLYKLTSGSSLSSGAQSNDRRRQYEEHAQDTVQPYDAAGNPRAEFYRLYPSQAEKTFSRAEIEQVKRQL